MKSLLICFLLTFVTFQIPAQKKELPIIPFHTNFWNYWDHYWTTWLDDHPVYEAIELTTYENPKDLNKPLIRVFLSEKDGEKKQYFYLNDSSAVKRSRANSFYRDMTYKIEGEKDKPKSLFLSFFDKDSKKIEWKINFSNNENLIIHDGGLTPSIHSVGYVLLFHLRKQKASTRDESLIINGVEYALKDNLTESKKSWYNKGAYSSVIVFGKNNFTSDKNGNLTNRGRIFVKKNGNTYISNEIGPENYISFIVNPFNEITEYKHSSYGKSLIFNFSTPLPNYKTAKDGQTIGFSVSFDDNKDLMKGEVRIMKSTEGLVFTWKPLYPEWATWRAFKSVVSLTDKGYDLVTYE